MMHYHMTPINPRAKVFELAGHSFGVTFADPRQIKIVHEIGQSVMIDNGAFTYWKRNPLQDTPRDWTQYYEFIRPWLDYPTTWAVIPDVINGTEMENDRLICECLSAFGYKKSRQLAPVWHLHESLDRLDRLTTVVWDRVAFGSSGEYAVIGSDRWKNRMNEAFNRICKGSGAVPCWIHMLRGMSLAGSSYPFASCDSSDIAKNHHRPHQTPRTMAQQWDAQNCPARWTEQPLQSILTGDSRS